MLRPVGGRCDGAVCAVRFCEFLAREIHIADGCANCRKFRQIYEIHETFSSFKNFKKIKTLQSREFGRFKASVKLTAQREGSAGNKPN